MNCPEQGNLWSDKGGYAYLGLGEDCEHGGMRVKMLGGICLFI